MYLFVNRHLKIVPEFYKFYMCELIVVKAIKDKNVCMCIYVYMYVCMEMCMHKVCTKGCGGP